MTDCRSWTVELVADDEGEKTALKHPDRVSVLASGWVLCRWRDAEMVVRYPPWRVRRVVSASSGGEDGA